MGFSLSQDEIVLANEQEPDAIPAEQWAEAIEKIIEARQELSGYRAEAFKGAIERLVSDWRDTGEPPSEHSIELAGEYLGELGDVDELSVEEYPDPDSFFDTAEQVLENADPAGVIHQEGSPLDIVENAMYCEDNLWSVLKRIYNRTAVNQTGNGIESFNKTFHAAVMDSVEDVELIQVAQVNGGHFFVVFDFENVRMDYAMTEIAVAAPGSVSKAISQISEINMLYADDLEKEQLHGMYQEAVKAITGSCEPMSRMLLRSLERIDAPEQVGESLRGLISEELSVPEQTEWSRDESLKNLYTKDFAPEPEEFDVDRSITRRRI